MSKNAYALQLQYALRLGMGYFFQILGADRERVEKFTAGNVESAGVVNRKQNVVKPSPKDLEQRADNVFR
jgi:hypothetical protein